MTLAQKFLFFLFFTGLVLSIGVWVSPFLLEKKQMLADAQIEEAFPSDWFFRQRAYPKGTLETERYLAAIQEKKRLQEEQLFWRNEPQESEWTFIGPTNIGGRVTDLEMFPDDMQTIIVGTASGGIFVTDTQGRAWEPIFDEVGTLAIGDMAIASDKTIYVGTGEANAGGGSLAYDGTGIFKRSDLGKTWNHLGLEKIGSVGKIIVDPTDPNRLFVAGMGALFSPNQDRGIFRSTDGGASWEKVLFVNEITGGIDLAINPKDPSILYAAMWQRERQPGFRNYGGEHSNIYRSKDGGDSWEVLRNGLPQAAADKGRIGIAIAPSEPDILYAVYADQVGNLEGIYRTSDGGDLWLPRSISGIRNVSFMWWFGKIFVNPTDPDDVYLAALNYYTSKNGGAAWTQVFRDAHVDQHALVIHPQNPSLVVAGNDGGVYVSQNGGINHQKVDGLPATQFYTCTIGPANTNTFFGGTQDNGTLKVNGANPESWRRIYGGDGFQVLVSETNPDVVFAESQYGGIGISKNGGNSFNPIGGNFTANDRRNWNTPLRFDPNDPNTIYLGANRLFKSTNLGTSWTSISPDLSNGPGQNLVYGTITAFEVSPHNTNVIYAGTDDGNFWITKNGGNNWSRIDSGLPSRWVTAVQVDPIKEGRVYVTFSGFRWNENTSHIFMSENFGTSWIDVGQSLPDIPVNDLEITNSGNFLYVATDIGVFNADRDIFDWSLMTNGLPEVVVTDLDYNPTTQTLAAATYGRGMFALDLGAFTSVDDQGPRNASFKVWPNLVTSDFQAEMHIPQPGQYRLELFNAQGQLVAVLLDKPVEVGDFSQRFVLPSLEIANGTYALVLRQKETGYARSVKIVIQR